MSRTVFDDTLSDEIESVWVKEVLIYREIAAVSGWRTNCLVKPDEQIRGLSLRRSSISATSWPVFHDPKVWVRGGDAKAMLSLR